MRRILKGKPEMECEMDREKKGDIKKEGCEMKHLSNNSKNKKRTL